jgi:hypothetical protein
VNLRERYCAQPPGPEIPLERILIQEGLNSQISEQSRHPSHHPTSSYLPYAAPSRASVVLNLCSYLNTVTYTYHGTWFMYVELIPFISRQCWTDHALRHSRLVSTHARPLIRAFPVISHAYACHQCANA